MAKYDVNADPVTAVNAWLAQFQVASNGAITYDAAAALTDTFHTTWLHVALQMLVYEFTVSGNDLLNLTKPNPSTSEALGTIITLQDHTASHGVNYTIDDTVMQYHFGGSISINNGDDVYYGMAVAGKTASATNLLVLQNEAALPPFWGTGLNGDADNVMRIMVKGRSGGVDIDNRTVIVRAAKKGDTFATWKVTLGLGEKSAVIVTEFDPQDQTAAGTVAGYTGIALNEGYSLLDVDGNGDAPFFMAATYGGNNKKALYEYTKYLVEESSANTVFGVPGKLWTGRIVDCAVGAGAGTFVQNERVTWPTGAGNLMAIDDTAGSSATRLVLHLGKGVLPIAGQTITGAGGATTDLQSDSVLVPSHPAILGQFTGSWVGAQGAGFQLSEITSSDLLKDLDGNSLSPLNSVPIAITVKGVTNTHLFLTRKDAATGSVDLTQLTVAAGSAVNDLFLDVNEAIPADTPQNGWLLIGETGTYEPIQYTSWSGSRFVTPALPQGYTSAKPVMVGFFYDVIAADGGTATTSVIYQGVDIDLAGWAKFAAPGSVFKPALIDATVGAAGLSLTIQLQAE